MLQQRFGQPMGAVSKRGKSQHNDQKEAVPTSCRFVKTSSKSKGLFLLAYAVVCGQMLDPVLSCL
jgi:hypothetical protein